MSWPVRVLGLLLLAFTVRANYYGYQMLGKLINKKILNKILILFEYNNNNIF